MTALLGAPEAPEAMQQWLRRPYGGGANGLNQHLKRRWRSQLMRGPAIPNLAPDRVGPPVGILSKHGKLTNT